MFLKGKIMNIYYNLYLTFHSNRAYNFARLGFTVGHEISHAFNYDLLQPIFGCKYICLYLLFNWKWLSLQELEKNLFVGFF